MPLNVTLAKGLGLDSFLIPKIDDIIKLVDGNLGIAENLQLNSLTKIVNMNSNMDISTMTMFLDKVGLKTERDLSSYINNGKLVIPKSDLVLEKLEMGAGLLSLEKSIFKSIFETQKPYMEGAMVFVKALVGIEDVIARSSVILSPDTLVTKPQRNPESLYSKVRGAKDTINKLENLSKSDRKTVSTETISDIPSDNYTWKIVNIEYSTIVKLPIKYKTIYKDLKAENVILDNTDNSPEIEIADKPPVIVFDIFESDGTRGDINDTKWKEWLNRSDYKIGIDGVQKTKWYGKWEQVSDKESSKYDEYIKSEVTNQMKIKQGQNFNISQANDVFSFVKSKVNTQDIVGKLNKDNFLRTIKRKDINPKSYKLGNDSEDIIKKITKDNVDIYLPKTINYNGQDVLIDPELDYELQIIKLVPEKTYFNGEEDVNNRQLKRTTPLVGNYLGRDVRDVLLVSDYETQNLRNGYVINRSDSKRRVQEFKKYSKEGDDTETYIIEGILRDRNPDSTDENNYSIKHLVTAIPMFIKEIIKIATEIAPQIKNIQTLITKPHEFVFNIALDKIGQEFEALSSTILTLYSEVNKIKNIAEKVKYIKDNEILKKYLYIDEVTGEVKNLLDSTAIMSLLGFNFGLEFINLTPKFIFERNSRPTNELENFQNRGINSGKDSRDGGKYVYETVNIDYSTGDKIDGVNYKYIYIDQEAEKLVRDAGKALEGKSVTKENALTALGKYLKALSLDPNNQFLKDKITDLKSKFDIKENSPFNFLINIVSMPIKIVIKIFEKIMELFDNLNIDTLVNQVPEFLKFEWILELFSPTFLLSILGIEFNPKLLIDFINEARNSDDLSKLYDINKVMSLPFFVEFPAVNKEALMELLTKPLSVLTQFLKLIEEIINQIIEFIFNILNLGKVLKIPKVNFSSLVDVDNGPDVESNIRNSYTYSITLEDGTVIDNLTRLEVEDYQKNNPNLNYKFT